jgi:hypothetical protein
LKAAGLTTCSFFLFLWVEKKICGIVWGAGLDGRLLKRKV